MLTGVSSPVEVIRGSNSRVWIVQHSKEFMLLHFGWEGFINDNRIREGEILIIYYGGNMTIYVRIFSSPMVERFSSIKTLQSSMSSGGIGASDVDFREYLGIGKKLWFPWVITPACYGKDSLVCSVSTLPKLCI